MMPEREPLFRRLDALIIPPDQINPENWHCIQPCRTIKLGARTVVITQLSSSFWVYLLGILTLAAAIPFLMNNQGQVSRLGWGIALLLWGIGAILAGTSYQAFGYHIKRLDEKTCRWTSWWELVYMICQQWSMNVLLAAVCFSSTNGIIRQICLGYAVTACVVYTVIIFVGGFVPVKRIITFEFMVLFSLPGFAATLVINGLNQVRALDSALLTLWLGLFLISLIYWGYVKAGITQKLWIRKIWFTENDILHVTLILWMCWIFFYVEPLVTDL